MPRQQNLATRFGLALGALCVVLLVAAPTQASDHPGQLTEEFHQSYPLADGGRVSLENINGAVHISGWDKNEVKVDAVKYAHSK